VIVSGSELIAKNCFYNKLFADLQEKISNEAIEFKEITKKDKTKIKIPTKYTNKGRNLQKQKSKLMESRRRYFDDIMNKHSKSILNYLQKNKVTDLVISKNLSFTKTTGEIKMNKKTKQKFYQIPFGQLLNMIIEKSPMHNIFVHDKNEAYTSKTSCLTAEVNTNQKKKELKEPILPNDLNGNRGSKGRKLSRGLFKDKVLNVIINSDLNGAANHIRLAFGKVRITQLKNYLWKLQQPKKIKSAFEFNYFLNN
jgi:putative transposase